MIERNDILTECVDRCLVELYKWAQPTLDLEELRDQIKAGTWKEDKDHPLFRQHYLSEKNFKFIRDAYMRAYGLYDTWTSSIDLLLDNLNNGGLKEIYVRDGETGHKDFEKVLPLNKIISDEDTKKVIDVITDYRNFYKFGGRDANDVNFTITLGPSPTTNKEEVIEYWKSKNKEIEINDFDIETEIYGD